MTRDQELRLQQEEENRLKEEDDKRAIRIATFFSSDDGKAVLDDLGFYAGMHMPSHLQQDRHTNEGLIRDGMKTLFCKVRRAIARGKFLSR